jgi:hypothetical protein
VDFKLISLPILAASQMASSTRILGQVPFPFTVGNKHVPAGQYTVEPVTNGCRTLAIRGVGSKVGLFTPAMPTLAKKASGSYALVFHNYGDTAFLTGIKLAGDRTIYEIPKSPAEAELRAQNMSLRSTQVPPPLNGAERQITRVERQIARVLAMSNGAQRRIERQTLRCAWVLTN